MKLTSLLVPENPVPHPRRVLITGCLGQLGRTLQATLTDHVRLGIDLPDCDITDPAVVPFIEAHAPDIIIHTAAYTNVDGAESDPDLVFRINMWGTHNLALACQRTGAPLLYISTNEVFDGTRTTSAYYEWETINPLSVYARSKAAGEAVVRTLLQRFYIVRIAWLFAPGGNNFPRKIIENADKHGRLRVVSDEFGNPTYAPDLAVAISQLITTEHFGIYHLVNGGSCSRYEFASEVLRQAGRGHVPVTPVAHSEWERPSTPPLHALLANTNAAALGITLRPWQEALAAFFQTS
ncbi:MAG: dTDP-4-dehydrorhamnose reductase [Anaerolineae bacterium]